MNSARAMLSESDSAPPHDASAAVLALYRRLFDDLDRHGVDYCVWKNTNELRDALSGRGDIDLHVRPRARAAFTETLRTHGFVRVETHKRYPWVAHYYGFDAPSGTLCHLHCYFRLVTGESHIKQYVVPLERHLEALPSARNALGVREMHPWLQARVHRFRRRVKLSCLPGALLFGREIDGYRTEGERLERDGETLEERLPSDGWPATIAAPGTPWRDLLRGLAYRRRFRHWSRFPPLATPIVRYGVLPLRAAGKLLRWRKTLPLGLIVAVAGDGRHVETVRRELDGWFGGALRLHAFRLPDTDTDATPRRLLRRCRQRRATLRAATRSAANGAVSICYGWDPARLLATLTEAAQTSGTADSVGRALARCAARLDEAAEPDVLLLAEGMTVPDEDIRGATVVTLGAAGTTACWREELWRALVARQP